MADKQPDDAVWRTVSLGFETLRSMIQGIRGHGDGVGAFARLVTASRRNTTLVYADPRDFP